MLELKKISKVYGSEKNAFYALNDVNLKIAKGEIIAIVGKSGSGKSTLVHIMVGLDRATTGEVLFDSQPLKRKKVDSWRGDNVGIVFQQFFLQLQDSVIENVALPLKIAGLSKPQRRLRAMDALKQVDMVDKARNKANDLSGGQKQRVAIARAIISKPEILVTDEPTGNLDSENGKIVTQLLFDLNKTLKTTLVIVTHDEDLAEQCDRVIRIKDGKIVKDSLGKKSRKSVLAKVKASSKLKLASKTKSTSRLKSTSKPKSKPKAVKKRGKK